MQPTTSHFHNIAPFHWAANLAFMPSVPVAAPGHPPNYSRMRHETKPLVVIVRLAWRTDEEEISVAQIRFVQPYCFVPPAYTG